MSDDQKKPRRRDGKKAAPRKSGRKKALVAAAFKILRGRPPKDPARREADRQAFVAAAVSLLREGGPAALTTRNVAARTGTAVGSVYTAFESLEALRLEANATTMGLLRDCVAEALAQVPVASLEDRLLRLADAYTGFATEHRTLWMALFEPRTRPAPPALAAHTDDLFATIEGVLREAGHPGTQDAPVLAQALWAGVYGAVYLASNGSLGPAGSDDAAGVVHTLVRAIAGRVASGRTGDKAA